MKRYKQWRELEIDPFTINFKKIKLLAIESYLPAGNDVLACRCLLNNQELTMIIKIERSKIADFATEVKHLKLLQEKGYYAHLPQIIEEGEILGKRYIVLKEVVGERLSEIFPKIKASEKASYLIKYGAELATFHQIPNVLFGPAKQRVINEVPREKPERKFDELIKPYIDYLINHEPQKNNETFIHGDFHYANLLWQKGQIKGLLDYEYSGQGFKEQDIAWACILRPTQKFMKTKKDIKLFLNGYSLKGNFDNKKLKWCLINGICHFYLMNQGNLKYQSQLLKLLKIIMQEQIFN